MIGILRRGHVLALALALTGCVAGQSLETNFTPQASQAGATAGASVEVLVTDERPYVVSGEKPPHYVGRYRAGFGNPWNVSTPNDEPLAAVLARDLSADLGALGFAVRPGAPADRQLAVTIREWNFDGYQNGKMWYELALTVRDATGNIVATDTVREETAIKGTLWLGAKGGFEREMPKIYAAAVGKIARENAGISAALGHAAR